MSRKAIKTPLAVVNIAYARGKAVVGLGRTRLDWVGLTWTGLIEVADGWIDGSGAFPGVFYPSGRQRCVI
jgi:hypothetical protein